MQPPAGMCSTTFCARLIMPTIFTRNVCSRRLRDSCVKSSTASPYLHVCITLSKRNLKQAQLQHTWAMGIPFYFTRRSQRDQSQAPLQLPGLVY